MRYVTLLLGSIFLIFMTGACQKEAIEKEIGEREEVTEDEIIPAHDPAIPEGDHYYWYKEEKYPLTVDYNKRYLLLDEYHNTDELARRLRIGKSQIEEIRSFSPGTTLISHPSNQDAQKKYYWTILSDVTEEVDLSPVDFVYEAPFFRTEKNAEVGLSHLFYVKLHAPDDLSILEEYAQNNRVRILGHNSFMPLWYILSCDKDSKGNALKMANYFYESGFFSAAQADLMEDVSLFSEDTFLGD